MIVNVQFFEHSIEGKMDKGKLLKIGKEMGINISSINLEIKDEIGYLTGTLSNWEDVVELGLKVVKKYKLKNLVNDITVNGKSLNKPLVKDTKAIEQARSKGIIDIADVVIIGGGIIGSSIARELSKLNLKIILVEKEADVSCGTSKANNGMIHPGNGVYPNTVKVKMNLRGNFLYTQFAEELGFKFVRPGSVAYYEKGGSLLNIFLAWLACKVNKVPDHKLYIGKSIKKHIPSCPDGAKIAVLTRTSGYVDPFEVCIAAAENAADNGVKFLLNHEVIGIDKDERVKAVVTNNGVIQTKLIINAAGLYADYIAEYADDRFYTIHPRKGVIAILDKNVPVDPICYGSLGVVKGKNKHSKGGCAEKTVAGNALFGPSAREVESRDDLSVHPEDFDYAYRVGHQSYQNTARGDVIAYFAGLRAATYNEDFVIEESKKVKGFIHCAGIQSPGIASAPAIAEYVKELVEKSFKRDGISYQENPNFNPYRKKPIIFNELSNEEKDRLIKGDPRYGNVVCRCETITEGEIVAAMHRSIPCTTIEGLKRRIRVTAGRCQGGFCGPRIIEIMARELNVSPLEISQKGKDRVLIAKTRQGGEKHE